VAAVRDPFNRLFLLDVAMLALAAWSAGALLWQTDVAGLGSRFTQAAPVRGVAVYVWAVVTVNAVAWLIRIVPAHVNGGPPTFLRGTGLPTNPGYIQDLALWLPCPRSPRRSCGVTGHRATCSLVPPWS
jgi:hypothetical protein